MHAARETLKDARRRIERAAREVGVSVRVVELFGDAVDLVDEALVGALERFQAHG